MEGQGEFKLENLQNNSNHHNIFKLTKDIPLSQYSLEYSFDGVQGWTLLHEHLRLKFRKRDHFNLQKEMQVALDLQNLCSEQSLKLLKSIINFFIEGFIRQTGDSGHVPKGECLQ